MGKQKKRLPQQKARCYCGQMVRSNLPFSPDREEAFVQGVNCRMCGAFHIFSTDNGHIETPFRFVQDTTAFYRVTAALDDIGLLEELVGWSEDAQETAALEQAGFVANG
jgi:hypothetical protein